MPDLSSSGGIEDVSNREATALELFVRLSDDRWLFFLTVSFIFFVLVIVGRSRTARRLPERRRRC